MPYVDTDLLKKSKHSCSCVTQASYCQVNATSCTSLHPLQRSLQRGSSEWYVKANEPKTRAVCKVRGLTLLLRVRTLWRCSDGFFFEVHPLASDALFTTLHPLLENVLQTVDHFEISSLGAPFSWLKKPRNRMWRDLDCMADVVIGFH
jgi:hypothetical protein